MPKSAAPRPGRNRHRPGTDVRALAQLRLAFGPDAAQKKLALLKRLAGCRFQSAKTLLAFHEELLFLRAVPDDETILALAESLLAGFAGRRDLIALRDSLADSGIAGTDIRYPFFHVTARWLTARWPHRLEIDWAASEDADQDALERLLPLISHYSETMGLDDHDLGSPRAWFERLVGKPSRESKARAPSTPRASDAHLLLDGLDRSPGDGFTREYAFDRLGLSFVFRSGPGTPSRTEEYYRTGPACFRSGPLKIGRPSIPAILEEQPVATYTVAPAEGESILDLARSLMVNRSRDLDVFAYGSPDDVRIVQWEDGLAFAAIGFLPERRLMLESVYGLITLRNGVPMGYVLISAFNRSSEIAYNVFPNYRGFEAGHVYGRVLATARHLFHSDTFTVYPYQLGQDNEEALDSGAWWFYQKLGFRPKDRATLKLMKQELQRMKLRPKHRSSRRTLEQLAQTNVYLHVDEPRNDVIGLFDTGAIGLRVTDWLAQRFGGDRTLAQSTCVAEAAQILDVTDLAEWTPSEALWFGRWAPLALLLRPESWSPQDRHDLVQVIRAKGGPRESDYIERLDRHPRVVQALTALSAGS